MNKKAYRKRKIINFSIKRDLQLRLISRILVIILLAIMLSGAIFYLGSNKKTGATYYQFHVQLRNFKDLILPLAIIGMFAGLFGAIILSLFFPLRLAGPLYRLEKTLIKITGGDLSDHTLNIRPGDELQDIVCQVRDLTCRMRETIISLKERNKEMDVLYSQIANILMNQKTRIPKEITQEIDENIIKTKKILDEFKI